VTLPFGAYDAPSLRPATADEIAEARRSRSATKGSAELAKSLRDFARTVGSIWRRLAISTVGCGRSAAARTPSPGIPSMCAERL
jgi:hypothetical protein